MYSFVPVGVLLSSLESQFLAVYKREQVSLTMNRELAVRNRELEARVKELEAKVRRLEEELDGKQGTRRLVEKLFDPLKLQIEFVAIQHFRDFADYQDELTDYGTVV